ncbi:YciI family protein [Pseudoalteromonas sp. S2755]|uniref:YciI family protein n=1 Tax=Pseudoalteromonas sp. S2755 TaxID=2066523 RepID=UPI00110AC123|nr:YciI family protein [Pseudoalteromonas sp. S2755]TMN38303.1 hypothetical protein CWC03_11505 [Pseudoalteromonas sp. S2755]
MKVMVIVKASEGSEAGVLPTAELMAAMGEFNNALVDAGIMTSGDGLKPSKEGVRVRFKGEERIVTKGPFAETNELIAGYWVWEVTSMEEALEWVKRCPNPMNEESDIEVRPFYEMADFADIDPSGEILEDEEQLRQKIAMQTAHVCNYLFFAGRTEEALEYYQQHLCAKVGLLMRFNESPDPIPDGAIPENFSDKVMHCEFSIGDIKIFASDGCGGDAPFAGFSLSITIDSEPEAHRAFNALADGGTVKMPLQETFWSPLYGQVVDKFGVAWIVMLPSNAAN